MHQQIIHEIVVLYEDYLFYKISSWSFTIKYEFQLKM